MIEVIGRASFSRDGRYRYSLTRRWDEGPRVTWVMLNPSTADATHDDPTLRRVLAISRRAGFGALEVVNLGALCSAHPADLTLADDPIGPRADIALWRALARADAVVAAWGVPPRRFAGRAEAVHRAMVGRVSCLGLTGGGHPRHPLYVRGDVSLVPLASLTQRSPGQTMAA